jgi:acylphosphatase
VEVLALGDAVALGKLAAWLRQGPTLARVTGVREQVEDATHYADLAGFRSG